MITEKILPIKYPYITSLPAFANTCAILSAQKEEEILPWFCHNHIQLVAWDEPEMYIQFYSPIFRKFYRMFTLHHYKKETLMKWCKNITEFIIDEINGEGYVYLSIDKYYIPDYTGYKLKHSAHDMLIYGYNKLEKNFYIADFFQSSYAFSKTSFNNVENAFLSQYSEGEWFKGMQILQFNKCDYTLDLEYLIKQLNDYLCENKSSKEYKLVEEPGKDSDAWGIGIYRYLQNYTTNAEPSEFSLIRSLHLLSDHKEVMLRTISYLGAKGCIVNQEKHEYGFREIKRLCLILRNICLKHSLSKGNRTLVIEKIKKMLVEIETKERKVIFELLLDVKQNSLN
ncbi:hypothetical protein [Paenibacillus taichungensis]|uniref:hypothetical protein n=1 Tax=Paenibacillus taichungensis TaxID=484184 RepID=UPI0038D08412